MTLASKVPPTFVYRGDPEERACSLCWPSWMARGVGPPSLSCCITSENRLFATPWTVAYQAPPSIGFSRQECWSGLPFPSLGDLPDPGTEPGSPTLQADAYHLSHQGSHEFEQIPGDSEGQGSLACCSPCGIQNWTRLATGQQGLSEHEMTDINRTDVSAFLVPRMVAAGVIFWEGVRYLWEYISAPSRISV